MGGLAFEAETSALAAVLRDVVAVASRNAAIDIAGFVLIEAGADGRLTLSSTNLDVHAVQGMAAVVTEPGAIAVSAHRFQQIVAALDSGSQVRVSTGERRASIVSGRAKFQLGTLPATDFPKMPFDGAVSTFSLDAKALGKAVATVRPSICGESSRYWLCGTYMHVEDGILYLVSTDGDRMTRVGLAAPAGSETMPPSIVQPTITQAIERAAGDSDRDARLEFTADKVRVTIGDLVITGRAIEGTYPDYRRAIPSACAMRATVDRDALERALGRVIILTEGKRRTTRFDFTADSVTLSANGTAEQAVEDVPAAFVGEAAALGFNAAHLREGIRTLDADMVEIGWNNAADPALITNPARPDALIAISPIRV